jgi:hypothetical protein
MYYGRRQYFADSLQINVRTLQRIFARLRALGLIEDAVSEDGRYRGVRTVDIDKYKEEKRISAEREAEARKDACEAPGAEKQNEAKGSVLPFWTDERREAAYRGFISRNFGRVSSDEEAMLISEYKEKGINADSVLLRLGIGERVRLTREQYKALAELVSANRLHGYIERLDSMLNKNEENGMQCYKPHYQVLRKWIREDLRADR